MQDWLRKRGFLAKVGTLQIQNPVTAEPLHGEPPRDTVVKPYFTTPNFIMDTEPRIADLQKSLTDQCAKNPNAGCGFTTRRLEQFNFSQALEYMKKGAAVRRYGWNGPHFIQIQNADYGSTMNLPYIFLTTGVEPSRVPWVASQTDLLADDWYFSAPSKY